MRQAIALAGSFPVLSTTLDGKPTQGAIMQNPNSLMQWRQFHLATINHIRAARERALADAFTDDERAWFRRPLGESK